MNSPMRPHATCFVPVDLASSLEPFIIISTTPQTKTTTATMNISVIKGCTM